MRPLPLILVAAAGLACRRGALQEDAGGTGTTGFDTGLPGGNDAIAGDGPGGALDAPGAADVRLPTANANCGMVTFTKKVLAAEILVVLDRSIAVDPARWNTFLSAVIAMINRNGAAVDWGLYAFPKDGPACGAETVSTAIDVQPTPDDATHVIAHIAAAGTGASSTPTAAAIDVAAAYMLSRTTPNPKFLLLVTDGAPSCAGRTGALSADPPQAEADAIAAVTAAKAAGLPTFVVAPSTTAAAGDVAALNALAEAGGYAERGDIKFDTDVTISTWFQQVNTTSTCTFSLGLTPPPVPDVVTVTVNGVTVPRDRSHMLGWDYTTPSATAIQLYGSSCDTVISNRSGEVDVYYGCASPG